MIGNIEQKIRNIQSEPEGVRAKYLLVAVVVSMIAVVFLWILSAREGLRGISQEAPALKETILPDKEGTSIQNIGDPSSRGESASDLEQADEYFRSEFGRSR